MFTGIVQELALVDKVTRSSFGVSLEIARPIAFADIEVGESIALNGTCLTVASYSSKIISFDVVKETLDKTNINYLKKGHSVNLERCMKLSSRIEGHIVLGHVESTATVLRHIYDGESSRLSVAVDDKTLRYCIVKGSIAIDGVSLTIASIDGNIIEVALIPHTLEHTNLSSREEDSQVNIETDVLGRYIDHFLLLDNRDSSPVDYIAKRLKQIQYGES